MYTVYKLPSLKILLYVIEEEEEADYIQWCLYMYFLHAWTLFTVCRLLSTAQGSLLDDEALVNTLQSSKKTSEEVGEQLQVAEQTEAKIDAAREVGMRLSLLKSLQQAHPHWFFSACVVWVLSPSTMYTHTHTHTHTHTLTQ